MNPIKFSLAVLFFACFLNVEVESLFGLILTPTFATAGLITGVLGTVLGAITLKIELDAAKTAAAAAPAAARFGYGHAMDHHNNGFSSYSSYRKRRSITPEDASTNEEEQLDNLINDAYTRDPTRCLDMLVCEVAARSTGDLKQDDYQAEENGLVNIAKYNSNRGYTFKRMEAAMKAGFGGSNCKILFDTCPYEAEMMLRAIKHQMMMR